MRVLVTGGAGFLGAYIVAALEAAGHEAFALDIATPSRELLTVAPALTTRLHIGGVDDAAGLLAMCRDLGIEAIVHNAARLGLAASLEDPAGFYRTNIMGMVNVCEAARTLGIPKLVAISSNAAYHPGKGEKLVETDPSFSITRGNPAGHYGTSKMAAEAIGMAYADFHGLEFIALRITAVYGFGMRVPIHVKPMVENALRGQPTRFADGGPMRRDYTHVEDCAAAIRLALELPPQPPGSQRILNVAAGRVSTSAEIAAMVRRVLPGADIEIGDTLTPLDAENVKMRAPLESTVARRVLGWSPRYETEAGIRHYAERFRSFIATTEKEP